MEEVESGGGVVDAVGSPLDTDDMVVRERRKRDKRGEVDEGRGVRRVSETASLSASLRTSDSLSNRPGYRQPLPLHCSCDIPYPTPTSRIKQTLTSGRRCLPTVQCATAVHLALPRVCRRWT